MMVAAEARRAPRLPVSPEIGSRYVQVICTGTRPDGRSCSQVLGEFNPNHPHDLRYYCRRCRAVYELRNP